MARLFAASVFAVTACVAAPVDDTVEWQADASEDTSRTSDSTEDRGAGVLTHPSGFAIRIPGTHEIEPVGSVGDVDYVCTLVHGDLGAHVYVQSSPASCAPYTGCEFETVGAWMSFDGTVVPVDAVYGWGGHHHIDWIRVEYEGLTYRFGHSSIGWGWQPCAPPDCIQVLDADGSVVQDGCEPIRSLPAVCRQIRMDGTHEALEDDFEVCDGDPDP